MDADFHRDGQRGFDLGLFFLRNANRDRFIRRFEQDLTNFQKTCLYICIYGGVYHRHDTFFRNYCSANFSPEMFRDSLMIEFLGIDWMAFIDDGKAVVATWKGPCRCLQVKLRLANTGPDPLPTVDEPREIGHHIGL